MDNCTSDIINLSPADIPKHGGCCDLPITIGVLALGGDLRPIRGVLPVVSAVAETGRSLICPVDNGVEAALVQSCDCMLANNLLEVAAWMDTVDELPRAELKGLNFNNQCPDLSDVKGQEQAKRALIIAAAGKHNLLILRPIKPKIQKQN